MPIQFAADAEWPFSVDANAGIRVEFFLPAHQPFHGRTNKIMRAAFGNGGRFFCGMNGLV